MKYSIRQSVTTRVENQVYAEGAGPLDLVGNLEARPMPNVLRKVHHIHC